MSTRGRTAEETLRFNARAGPRQEQAGHRADQRWFGLGLRNCGRRSSRSPRATVIGTRSFGKARADHHSTRRRQWALRLTTARYFTPSGRSIQAKGISPDIEVLQEVPEELKARTDTSGEASLRGHLKAEGDEQTGSLHLSADLFDRRKQRLGLDSLLGTSPEVAALDDGAALIGKFKQFLNLSREILCKNRLVLEQDRSGEDRGGYEGCRFDAIQRSRAKLRGG